MFLNIVFIVPVTCSEDTLCAVCSRETLNIEQRRVQVRNLVPKRDNPFSYKLSIRERLLPCALITIPCKPGLCHSGAPPN